MMIKQDNLRICPDCFIRIDGLLLHGVFNDQEFIRFKFKCKSCKSIEYLVDSLNDLGITIFKSTII